jgi:hypothetical protein
MAPPVGDPFLALRFASHLACRCDWPCLSVQIIPIP